MFFWNDKLKIEKHCEEIERRLKEKHLRPMKEWTRELVYISDEYPGVWLEHAYDSVVLAQLYPECSQIEVNTMDAFMHYQKEDGQLPFVLSANGERLPSFRQLQEVVSFAKLCWIVYTHTQDEEFLLRAYRANCAWDAWLRKFRMTTNRGLVEMFVGFDTGHDNSARMTGMSCPYNNKPHDANVLPPEDDVTPILAVDINCTFYATQKALAKMSKELGFYDEVEVWEEKAKQVKAKLFEYCFDEGDYFFYDVDKHNRKRKYLSCTVFHLFSEGVLDKEEDRELIQKIYTRHIKNPNEFWTEYPFPSMAICDPSFEKSLPNNCWGYFSQALTALRCTLWMDEYGYGKDFDHICEKWVRALTEFYEEGKFGQELDPMDGKPSGGSEWYSSCMLFYVYAVRRLKIL